MSQQLWASLERQVPQVVDRTLRRYVELSPHYRGPVPEHLYRHMAHTCRELFRLFLRAVRERRAPRADELELFRERGRERGLEGLPVSDFLHAYLLGIEELWAEAARQSEGDLPTYATAVLLDCLHQVLVTAISAHQEEFQAAHGDEREAIRALARALAAGEPAVELAARFDLRLAPAYGALALRFSPDPAESAGDSVGRRLAEHRRVSQLLRHLRRALPDDALAALDPDGGLVLLPSTPDGSAAATAAAQHAIPQAQRESGVEITAGFAHAADLAAIPAAVRQAEKLLPLASAPGGVAVLDDHLFEFHLSHESAAVPKLRSIASRLRGEPDLLTTLTAYLETDFNRRETARRLHVHPNTVDNRLARIAALTGADPRTAKGVLLFGAALGLPG
ncbi:PucR family transcriptional regulator [Amycolatopsis benzoatilytica]|uniref:PucR family transcriptional regulator n=1 Tax=Amycolatopsis benzoatilytica TaxID=346045 RepID=UPI0006845A3A|nr:helix-turn-helix domain-containing protein [Amycolatopsis benzoatilytica]